MNDKTREIINNLGKLYSRAFFEDDKTCMRVAYDAKKELESLQWIRVEEETPESGRVIVYTPNPNIDLEYRVIDGALFKQVCTEATHWKQLSPPEESSDDV